MDSWVELEVPPMTADVLAEVFGDEAVVVQLRTGAYFAFDPATTELWTRLWQSGTFGAVLDGPSADVPQRAQLHAFVRFLVQEELLQFPAPPPDLTGDGDAGHRYAGIEKFTDMEDLLVLDPIHDIDLDGSGWPTVADVALG